MQGTLVGLLAAFSYELSILHTASRLTSADAFRTLHALYRERTHPVALSSDDMASSSNTGGALFAEDLRLGNAGSLSSIKSTAATNSLGSSQN